MAQHPCAQGDHSIPQSLRLFIAVVAPPPVGRIGARVVDRLQGRGRVRWVTPDRMHLTLKFLGSVREERVPDIANILEECANRFSSFVVELGNVGAFPHLRKPQTIWLGIERAEPLSALAEEIDRALGGLGFAREQRAFRPHLTLGRVKGPRDLGDLAAGLRQLADEPPQAVEWPVEEIELVRSDLLSNGPVYSTLHRFSLQS